MFSFLFFYFLDNEQTQAHNKQLFSMKLIQNYLQHTISNFTKSHQKAYTYTKKTMRWIENQLITILEGEETLVGDFEAEGFGKGDGLSKTVTFVMFTAPIAKP